jgi:ABC-type transport system involved in multi-copper enzyme maturation permease subunit
MNVLPLIVRELRAEARRPNTYWLRALAAALLTALFVWSVWNFQAGSELGPLLFNSLSQGLHLALLVIVAALAADSVSREKREGTLGLLFLTPLTAHDIIVGKILIHVLRAVGLFVAVLPIVGLPFLLGGISIQSVLLFFGVLPSLVMIAVASGIVASVFTTEWVESIVWAELICVMLIAAQWIVQFIAANIIATRAIAMLPGVLTATIIIAVPFMGLVYAGMILKAAINFSAKRLKKVWQTETTLTESWWVKSFSSSDFWRSAFHWNASKARDRNPIAWLQEYNWSSRLTKWGWCALIFFAQLKLIFGWRQFMEYQLQLYCLLAIGIAFTAAASFRRERQTGALELLLVTPISARALIMGRLQGVWIHFLPAIAILGAVWTMGPQYLSLPLWASWYLVGVYFCIPIVGFYSSLLTTNVLIAWLLTLLLGQFLPYAITQALRFDIGRRNVPFAFFLIQALIAVIAGALLYENLVNRRFVLRAKASS